MSSETPARAVVASSGRQGRSTARARFNQIHEELRDRIGTLVYPPGTALGEAALAEEFGVSRTPIRRVLGRLEFDGLVEIRHGVGTIVTDIDVEQLRDVYELRMKLAELIGVLDPVTPGDDNIAALQRLLIRLRGPGLGLDHLEFWRLNKTLHFEIGKCTGNGPLREVSERLYFLTNRTWQAMVPEMDWQEEIDIFAREIEDAILCMELGDVVGLGMLRRNAISVSFLRLLKYRHGIGRATASPASDGHSPARAASD
jgi:DNA-binding GntR family transcriptional regulator